MTIYVPDALRRRMDAAAGTNWSSLACRAFEARLAELDAEAARRSPLGAYVISTSTANNAPTEYAS
jgi:hypothetical protein